MKIAFLGLGKMGSAVAGRLVASTEDVTVWNRTAAAVEPLVAKGALSAETPSDAVQGAEVVFTMLNDDAAVEEVALGGAKGPGFVNSLQPGAIHVSLSTISAELSRKLSAEHAKADGEFVAAPVFGRPNVAAEGKLWLAVGGNDTAVARVRPFLEKFSRGITLVSGEPWRAHALKIGGNFLITAMIESLSEAMVFAEAHGIDPALFLDTVNNALFRSPFYEAYGKVMVDPPEHPGATISLGAKDMGLFRNAAQEAKIKTPMADHFAADLQRAGEAGLGNRDWAAGLYQLAKNTSLAKQ